jgi:hypothetical protein
MSLARMKYLVLGLVAVSACGGGSKSSSGYDEPNGSVARRRRIRCAGRRRIGRAAAAR